jgi:transcriptional regulator with XRE-family HTH domain
MKPASQHYEALQTILEEIGKKLRQLRIRKGYASFSDFASSHGLPPIQYWRIEKGKANVTLKSLHRILAIHSLTFAQLFIDFPNEIQRDAKTKKSRKKK